jgi:hypothetical protein
LKGCTLLAAKPARPAADKQNDPLPSLGLHAPSRPAAE